MEWLAPRRTPTPVARRREYAHCGGHIDFAFDGNGRKRRHPRAPTHIYGISLLMALLLLATSPGPGAGEQLQQTRGNGSAGDKVASPFRIVIDAGSTGSRLHIFELVTATVATAGRSADNASADETKNDSAAPRVECLRRGSSKAWTPLSAFAMAPPEEDTDNIQDGPLNATHVAHHMLPLFDYASIIIPPKYHASTSVRIAATAGMRLLTLEDQSRVYDALYEGLTEQVATGRFAFANLRREDVMTLDGEREGYYGAVAANYLRGVVDAELNIIVPPDAGEDDGNADKTTDDQGLCTNKFGMCEQDAESVVFGPSHHYVPQHTHDVKKHGPLGALDMGGSSTQIVYRGGAGSSDGERYDAPDHLDDEQFFSTSYLSYGADQFRERLWDMWVSEYAEKAPAETNDEHGLPVIFNPCSFVGYQMSYRGYSLLGTGNALLCAEQINRLIPHHDDVIDLDELYDENVESSLAKEVHDQPTVKRKMVGGVEHPPLKGKFYGMSLYFFTLDCLRELSDPDHPIHVSWPTPSIEELTHALDAFCAREWKGDLEEVQGEAHEHTRAEVMPHRCVEAVYMVTLLRDGFGFHPSSRDITFTQWVEGNEVEWSLGMALSEFAAERK
ncbi:hypothetical protein ACHAXT_007719 [Thalassiosira profunda]